MATYSGPKKALFRLLEVKSRQQTPKRTGRAPPGRTAQRTAVSRKEKWHVCHATNRVGMKTKLANANYIDATQHATPAKTDKRSRNSEGEQRNTGRNSKKERQTKNRDTVRARQQPAKFHTATAPPLARSPCPGRDPGNNKQTLGNLEGRKFGSEKRSFSAVGSTVATTDTRANRAGASWSHCQVGRSFSKRKTERVPRHQSG